MTYKYWTAKKKKILIFISVKEVLIRRSELLDVNLKSFFLLVRVNREMRISILKKNFSNRVFNEVQIYRPVQANVDPIRE